MKKNIFITGFLILLLTIPFFVGATEESIPKDREILRRENELFLEGRRQAEKKGIVPRAGQFDIIKGVKNAIKGSPSKDLYLRIYKNASSVTHDAALTRVSAQTSAPKESINKVLNGEIPDKLKDWCGTSMRIELKKCIEIILKQYEFEYELAKMEYELQNTAAAQEIWSNGTLEDSSFDIIVDLNTIEVIIFGRNRRTPLQRFPKKKSKNIYSSQPTEKNNSGSASTPSEQSNKKTGTSSHVSPLSPKIDQTKKEKLSHSSYFLQNSLSYFINTQNAKTKKAENNMCRNEDIIYFKDYLSEEKRDVFIKAKNQAINIESNKNIIKSKKTTNASQQYENMNRKFIPPAAFIDTRNPEEITRRSYSGGRFSFLPETEDTCEGEKFYGGLFCLPKLRSCKSTDNKNKKNLSFNAYACLEINFKDTDDTTSNLYSESDNCINCHLKFINKKLDNLLKYNLTPGRNTTESWEISRNWDFENNPFLYVYFISKPVEIPRYDPFLGNFGEEPKKGEPSPIGKKVKDDFREIMDKAKEIKGQVSNEYNKYRNQQEDYERRMQNLVENMPEKFVWEQIEKQNKEFEKKLSELLKTYIIEKEVLNQKIYWESLSREMEQMNNFFLSFQIMFNHLGREVAEKIEEAAKKDCCSN